MTTEEPDNDEFMKEALGKDYEALRKDKSAAAQLWYAHYGEVLRHHKIDPALDFLDQIARLPKEVIYRLAYECLRAELPRLATLFLKCLELAEPVSTSGRELVNCVRDQRSNVETMTADDFVRLFKSQYQNHPTGASSCFETRWSSQMV